jgi:hypothetical protein
MIRRWWRQFGEWLGKFGWFRRAPRPYELLFVEADELPQELPSQTLVVAKEGSELWTAGMVCPCGCGRRIELMLLEGVKPRWDLLVERSGNPSLKPSVWVRDGCRSHFWLRDGQVHWCRD